MVDCPDCPVRLRGLSTPGADSGPTLLKRTDQEFLQAVLDELSAEDGLAGIASSVATIPAGEPVLKLFQPVHRTFNLAALEIYCDVFGEPRLDPRRIESAGLVVRRVYVDPQARTSPLSRRLSAREQKAQQMLLSQGSELYGRGLPALSSTMTLAVREQTTAPVGLIDAGAEQLEGWMKSGQALQGWLPLAPAQLDQDPDPTRRRPTLRAGLPLIDVMLSATGQVPLAEDVAPLFVAPPEVCRATGKTVLYGLIPVISSEMSEVPETMPPFPDDAVIAHLSGYLLPGTPPPLPRAKQVIGADAADAADMAPFVTMLRQVAIELDAFGVTPAATALYAELNQVLLPFTPDTLNTTAGSNSDVAAILNMGSEAQVSGVKVFQARAGDYLRSLSPILLERQKQQSLMPDAWPEIGQDQGQRLLAAIKAAMTTRLAVVAPRGALRRYRAPVPGARLRTGQRRERLPADGDLERRERAFHHRALVRKRRRPTRADPSARRDRPGLPEEAQAERVLRHAREPVQHAPGRPQEAATGRGERGRRHSGPAVDLQLQHPDHHAGGLYRAVHFFDAL